MASSDPTPLDEVDSAIIDVLSEDGRVSVNALAGRIGISRANAYRRLDRLVDEEVITRFTVEVDPARVGLPVTVLILIGVQQRRWSDTQRLLADLPGLAYLAATTGEFDFLALVRLADVSLLRDVVLEHLQTTPGVTSTRTVFVLDESGSPRGRPAGPAMV